MYLRIQDMYFSIDFAIEMDSHFQSVNLNDFFSRVSGHLIIIYLKEIGL